MKNQNLMTRLSAAFAGLLFLIFTASGQETAAPTPTPPTVQTARKQSPRRVSNVKMTESAEKDVNQPAKSQSDPTGEIKRLPTPEIDAPAVEREKQAEVERRAAADAALEREKAKAVAETEAKAKIEADVKQAEFEAQKAEFAAKQKELSDIAAAEKAALAAELEKSRQDAENKAFEIQKKAEEEKRAMEEQAAVEKNRLETERAAAVKKAEDERIEREKQAENDRLERERLAAIERETREKEAETARETQEKQAESERQMRERLEQEAAAAQTAMQLEIENRRKEAELAKQKADAENTARIQIEAKAKTERETMRNSIIEQTARSLNFLKPEDALTLVPKELTNLPEIETFLTESAKKDETLVRLVDYCNTGFKGESFTYTGTSEITLGDFIDQISERYRVDFIPDSDVLSLPIRLSVNNKPWDKVLRQQLNLLDVQATCDGGIIALVKRQKFLAQQESNRKTAPLRTERIVLQHLRVRAGSQVDLSGKQNSADPIITLEQTLQKILQTGGDTRGTVAQVPGRAEFFIKATEDQLRDLKEQIALADRPRYRVDVFGLIYTVNENKLKDIGSQLSVILSNGGGITTLPPVQQSGGGTGTNTAQTNNFPGGFSPPSNSLGAGGASTIVGAQVNVGIVDFRYQLSLLEQFGVAQSLEKPFVSAKDGTTSVFNSGTKIPVVIQALNNFGGGSGGSVTYIDAGTILSVSPQIAFDGDDKPRSVSLNMRLESNTPNTSIQTNGVPAVNARSIQLDDVTLIPGQAFIFGGSNNRLESNTVSRTPGLGGLPLIGNLFKRTNRQINDEKIYFAVTVQISEDNGNPPVNPFNLDTTFAAPPPMNQPLKPTKLK